MEYAAFVLMDALHVYQQLFALAALTPLTYIVIHAILPALSTLILQQTYAWAASYHVEIASIRLIVQAVVLDISLGQLLVFV